MLEPRVSEHVVGSLVDIEMCLVTDVPEDAEHRRISDSLRRLFPRAASPRLVLLLAWSGRRQIWKIRSARQRVSANEDVDRSEEVAKALAADGIAIEVAANPMDSPPYGARIARRP